MADDATELQDSQPVEDVVQDPEPTVPDSEGSAEDLAEKNRQLYERAKKAEVKAKELEAKLKSKEANSNPSSDTDERFERLELKTEGYNADEVDFLMQNGGRRALDNTIAMAGIAAIRAKAKSQQATPTGTNKSPVYKKFTEADLRRMPLEELEKIMPQE